MYWVGWLALRLEHAVIRSHRGVENRLGFAVLLAYMRFPGVLLGVDEDPAPTVLAGIASQL